MNDSKSKPPVLREPAKTDSAKKPPVLHKSMMAQTEVRIVPLDQVKVRTAPAPAPKAPPEK